MRLMRIAAAAALIASVAAPPTLADGRNPGSSLIFPVHRSGSAGSNGNSSYFTVVCVTNTNTLPSTPNSFGGTTLVHYEYANVLPSQNPPDPFKPLGCIIFNRVELLTPADTLCVLTSCHNAAGPQGQEGYLVVSAQDPSAFDVAWAHDYLVGSELVINGSGGVYSLNAIPFEARVAAGQPTDVNGNGRLDYDDNEYEGIPDVLYIDSFIALGGSQLALLNLTGSDKDVNVVQLSVWNDNEFPLSAQRHFNCWFDVPLALVSPLFTEGFLQNSTPHDLEELDTRCSGTGTYETGWARIDSLDVHTSGGLPVASDGALLGSITAGNRSEFDGGHLLWESTEKQLNGSFRAP